jgi:hypothetical protein
MGAPMFFFCLHFNAPAQHPTGFEWDAVGSQLNSTKNQTYTLTVSFYL